MFAADISQFLDSEGPHVEIAGWYFGSTSLRFGGNVAGIVHACYGLWQGDAVSTANATE